MIAAATASGVGGGGLTAGCRMTGGTYCGAICFVSEGSLTDGTWVGGVPVDVAGVGCGGGRTTTGGLMTVGTIAGGIRLAGMGVSDTGGGLVASVWIGM